jgi:hypothetical protein
MCNAYGHSRSCNCGFGGDTGGGGTPHQHVIAKIRGSGWRISTLRSRLTHPTKCWWCQKAVYFHRDENGGCALFDALGWPWPVHGCWTKHREEQRAHAISGYEKELRAFGFDGITYRSRATPVLAPLLSRERPTLHGFIVRTVPTDPLLAGRAGTGAELHWVEVEMASALYRVVFPARVAALVRPHQICSVDAQWLRRERKWHLLARSITVRRKAQGKDTTMAGWTLPDAPSCTSCQRGIVPDTAWGLHPENGFECDACGTERASLSLVDFRARRKIQELLNGSDDTPLPLELVGSYSLDCKMGSGTPLKFTLSNDRRWRTEYGQTGGRFALTQDALRLYDDIRLLYTFRIIRSTSHDGIRLEEVDKDRSPFRKGRPGNYQGVRIYPPKKVVKRSSPEASGLQSSRTSPAKQRRRVQLAKPEPPVRLTIGRPERVVSGLVDVIERRVVQIQHLEQELDGLYPRLEQERDEVRWNGLRDVVREKSARVKALVAEARDAVNRLRKMHNKTANFLLLPGGPALRERLYVLEKRVPAAARQRSPIPSSLLKRPDNIQSQREARRAENGFGAILKQALDTPGQPVRYGM